MSTSIVSGTNSFVTLTEAESFFKTRFNGRQIWNETASDDRDASLITAWKRLTQCQLFSFPSDISSVMKDAQCEMALFLIKYMDDIDARKGLQAQGVIQAGIVQETYDKDMMNTFPIPAPVMELLKDYQIGGAGFNAGDLSRNDCENV